MELADLTFLQAASRYNKARWKIWGPCKDFPVGRLPFSASFRLRNWTFGNWQREGALYGLEVKVLQDPLYYYLLEKNIWKRNFQEQYRSCTLTKCGRVAKFFGVIQKGDTIRHDLCIGCSRNLLNRGRICITDLNDALPAG